MKFKLTLISLLIGTIFIGQPTVSTAEDQVTITSFGAKGDGKTDDTKSIQQAIDHQSGKGGGEVYFPKGVYLIDAIESVKLKDNINLNFERGSILQAKPNNAENYQILRIHDAKNVLITGKGEIKGERGKHLGNQGQWGFGISIRGSSNIVVENITISDCWGDGIYLGSTTSQKFNENIKIINPFLNNNRRQGISIISGKNVEITNAKITNTAGHPPQSGIDIEPNTNLEYVQDIKINNLSTSNNAGKGLMISLKGIKGSGKSVSIYVDSKKSITDGIGIHGLDGLKGSIRIENEYFLSNFNYVDLDSKHWAYNEIMYLSENKILTGYPNGKVQPERTTSRAEAAKMLVTALNLPVQSSKSYKDVTANHWAKDYISAVTSAGLFEGYTDGTFGPDKNLSRAEMSKVLNKAFKLKGTKKINFTDVKSNHWAYPYIQTLYNNGITTGFPNNTFQPNQHIKRSEFSAFLARAKDSSFK